MATHILTSLAVHEDKLNSSYLASSLNTNPVVVRRILGELQKAGLIQTDAGRSGGARLSKKPAAISLYDVYQAVDDGDLFAYNPNDPNKQCSLSCKMKSVLTPVFDSACEALAKQLKKIKLSDVVAEVDTT